MYRCYLIHHGRIASAENFAAATLDNAILLGHALLKADRDTDTDSGIELWRQTTQLYTDRQHSDDTGVTADVSSPFATVDSTMLPTWRPTLSRLPQ
jgi:hypothetical protein